MASKLPYCASLCAKTRREGPSLRSPLSDKALELFDLVVERRQVDGADGAERVSQVARRGTDGGGGERIWFCLELLTDGGMAGEAHGDGFGAAVRLCESIDKLDDLGSLEGPSLEPAPDSWVRPARRFGFL